MYDELDPKDYRDSASCRVLLKQIEAVVKQIGTARSRQINEAVEIPKRWSLDDIIAVSTQIEKIPGYVDAYVWRTAKKGIPDAAPFQVGKPTPKTVADLGL